MSDYRVIAVKKAVLVFSGIVSSILLARFLGPELRAEFGVLMNWSAILVVILNFGVSSAFQADRRLRGAQVVSSYLNWSCLLFIVCLIVSILSFIWLDSFIASVILVTSFSVFRLQALGYALVQNIKGSAYASICGGLGEVAFVFVCWVFFPGALFFAVLSIVLKDSVIILLSLVSLSPTRFFPKSLFMFRAKHLEHMALPVFGVNFVRSLQFLILTLLIVINYKMDVIFLDYLGVESELIGVFVVGVIISEYLWIFSDIFKDVQTSRTARGGGIDDVASATRLAFFVTLVVYFFFVLLGSTLIELFYGADYSNSFQVSILMLLANIFMIPCKIVGTYYISINMIRPYILIMIFSVIINSLLNIILIPSYGIFGAVFSSICAYGVSGCTLSAHFATNFGVKPLDLILIKRSDLTFLK